MNGKNPKVNESYLVVPPGIEPGSNAPEAFVVSILLRDLSVKTGCKYLHLTPNSSHKNLHSVRLTLLCTHPRFTS